MTGYQDKEIFFIRRKKKKNIIREIYLYDQTLIKRFIKTAAWPDMRQVWRMEDNALRCLEGLSVPKTYGFVEKQCNGAIEIIYAREYLEGNPLEFFRAEDIEPLAGVMAQIHQRGVITRDPSLENFIKTVDGKILFIDFGRSVIFNPKNPLFIDYQGKELARLRCHAFFGDDELYNRFQEKYFEFLPHSAACRFLIKKIASIRYREFAWKHMTCGL
ncbi:MAG: hypothetical protein J7K96_07425 [Desulfobacteraceae bacterium]|nr:hypothetical protein [Desulfobacteraceae bacterium]